MRTPFDVLGVPHKYHLSSTELEGRYLALSKELHPDKHATATAHERMLAVARSTELNDAYRLLKNEHKRAEYLLKLEGIHLGDDKPGPSDATKQLVLDPALLVEVMELREDLQEARADKDEPKIAMLTDDVKQRREAALVIVREGFTAYDGGDKSRLDAIARALVSLRYYGRFLDEVDAHQEAKENG